jgi:hypothetical protein
MKASAKRKLFFTIALLLFAGCISESVEAAQTRERTLGVEHKEAETTQAGGSLNVGADKSVTLVCPPRHFYNTTTAQCELAPPHNQNNRLKNSESYRRTRPPLLKPTR